MNTPKQREQQNLRQALGTVIGFHGYLNNLRTVVKRCTPKNNLLLTCYHLDGDINRLHHQLRITEDDIRKQLKTLDKLQLK